MEPTIGWMLLQKMLINIATVVQGMDKSLLALQETNMEDAILILVKSALFAMRTPENILNLLMVHLLFVKLQIG